MAKIITIPAREAKNRFGEMLDAVQRRPIMITKNGRPVAKLIAYVDSKRFEEVEDQIWAERAQKAYDEGDFLGPAESMKYLRKVLGSSYAYARSKKARAKISRKVAT
jgi:prevent-host-death family protein